MIIGVPKESYPGERRVALVPMVIPNLAKAGFELLVEAGAGIEAGYPDAQFAEKGARIVGERSELFRAADIIVQVLCYGSNDVNGRDDLALMRRGQVLVGFLRPFGSVEVLQEIAQSGVRLSWFLRRLCREFFPCSPRRRAPLLPLVYWS